MDLHLKDRVVLVTGAAQGLGKSIAMMLAEEGARVGVHYRRDPEKAEAVVDEIRRHFGGKGHSDLSAAELFGELAQKWHVYMLHVPYHGGGRAAEDERICESWRPLLGQNLIQLQEPKAAVDVILGCIALAAQTRDLDGYLSDMKDRGQSAARIGHVRDALENVRGALVPVDAAGLPARSSGKAPKTRGQRL